MRRGADRLAPAAAMSRGASWPERAPEEVTSELQAKVESLEQSHAELEASMDNLEAAHAADVAALQAAQAAQAAQIAELVEFAAGGHAARLQRVEAAQNRVAHEALAVQARVAALVDEVEELHERVENVNVALDGRFSELRTMLARLYAERALAQRKAGARDLDLEGVVLCDEGAVALVKALDPPLAASEWLPPLDTLNVTRASIQVRGAQALANALCTHTLLTRLDMSENPIGGDGAAAVIARLAGHFRLRSLCLASCAIGRNRPDVLADAIRGPLCHRGPPCLRQLSFNDNNLGAACVQLSGPVLATNGLLVELELASNHVGDDGAEALATALARNSVLARLNLSDNDISDRGAGALARALAHAASALKELYLNNNEIGDHGASAFAELLEANLPGKVGLTILELGANNVAARGAQRLAAALGANRTLTSLSLANGNDVGDAGARAFVASLNANRSLTCLDLADSEIEADGVAALVAALDAHRSLTHLILAGNVMNAAVGQRLHDRLRLNRLAATVPEWAADEASKCIELAVDRGIPPALAARAGLLAFGLLIVPVSGWCSAEGRAFAKRSLLPLAEAALLQQVMLLQQVLLQR